MDAHHQLLLAQVGRLYERHEAGRRGRQQFNIFTVLRSSTDEVNLHSRFLHALLDHRSARHGDQENLRDFLDNVAKVNEFPLEGAMVGREIDNIDLLIANDKRKSAVIIENKIWAPDRERQLQRYWEKLVDRKYDPAAIPPPVPHAVRQPALRTEHRQPGMQDRLLSE